MNFEISVFLFILSFYSLYAEIDYCKENVGCSSPERNTLCLYPPASQCEQHKVTLTDEKRRQILKLHNTYRADFANNVKDSTYPKAADMAQLTWDYELEKFAQRAADHFCVINGPDECHYTKRYRWVEQNRGFQIEKDSKAELLEVIDKAFNDWTSLISEFTPQQIPQFSVDTSKKPSTEFSQIIWGETRLIGCGEATYHGTYSKGATAATKSDVRVLICNYAPGGNTISQPVYSTGEPCSKCPAGGVCSTEHKGLCKIPLKDEDKEFAGQSDEEEGRGTQLSSDLNYLHFLSLIFMILQSLS